MLRLPEDLLLVVDIVDGGDKIEAFMPYLDEVMGEGLKTMAKVRAIACRHSPEKSHRQ